MNNHALVVDDSKIVRKVIRNILEPMGFQVTEAEDGKVAADSCAQKMPDLVMLDVNMPVMDGMECLEAVRALPEGSKPVIVMCTTVNELDFIQKAIIAGANEYVMKPFDAEMLQTKLEQAGALPLAG